MIEVTEPSRISGFTVTEVTSKMHGTGGRTLEVHHVLQDGQGAVHGESKHIGPWNEKTVEALDQLLECVQRELTVLHFGVEDTNDRPVAAETAQPAGILGDRLQRTRIGVEGV